MEIPHHVHEHIETIAKHEHEFYARRTTLERLVDRIARFAGSLNFIILHLLFFGGWILWNSVHRFFHFDPKPFALLDTIVALEAILLASIILMRQTAIGKRTDERDHLMLQLVLLNEKELSALIRISRELAERLELRVADDREIEKLAEPTSIDTLAQTIQENLFCSDEEIKHFEEKPLPEE